jgi:hypothetical protein
MIQQDNNKSQSVMLPIFGFKEFIKISYPFST